MNPIHIKISRVFPAKKWKVLRFLTRIENFKNFLPNVKECRVIEKESKSTVVTQWKAEIEGIPISWKERDFFDFENFTLRFNSIEGDLERFEGKWILEDYPFGGTSVTLELVLKIGLPIIENIVADFFRNKFKKNFEQMLAVMSEEFTMNRYRVIHRRETSDLKGFGIIAHPYNLQHLIRHFKFHNPNFKQPSQEFMVKIFDMTTPYPFYEVKEFKSKSGKSTFGCFIMCPIIPDMITLDAKRSIEKVVETCKVAEKMGIGIVALGGFASIVAQRFSSELASAVHIPMTTGNTFTVAMALEGIYKAARLMRVNLSECKVTIIGGAGDIGGTCARILAEKVSELTLTGRSGKNLIDIERSIAYLGKAKVKTSRDNAAAIKDADIVIAAASVSNSILKLDMFKPGAIICDVGYPKNISYSTCDRKDIFVFSGGITSLPMEIDLGYDTGLPSTRVLYGCFAEGILLDLEERYENFSWSRGNISKEKVDYMLTIAKKHGFGLAPFFWGERLIPDEEVAAFAKAKTHS